VQLKDVDVGEKQTGRGLVWNFFQWINKGSFEVSADAFTTFRVRLAISCLGSILTLVGNPHKAQAAHLAVPRYEF
jgi:hypothetical protein